jgi:predicted DNA-binding ribbon-helix-helix protein
MGNCVPSRNIMVSERRTSIRLEEDFWEALKEMGARENLTLSEILTEADEGRGSTSLTAYVRRTVLEYFRRAATDDGHRAIGHGTFQVVQRQSISDSLINKARTRKLSREQSKRPSADGAQERSR